MLETPRRRRNGQAATPAAQRKATRRAARTTRRAHAATGCVGEKPASCVNRNALAYGNASVSMSRYTAVTPLPSPSTRVAPDNGPANAPWSK